jgi:transposase, IS5 family
MQEGRMVHRSISQERLGFAVTSDSASSFNDLSRLIDWDRVAVILGQVHASAKGEPAWPPLAMFKALLLSVWYDLSDVKLSDALIAHRLDRLLFKAVTAQLQSMAVTVKTGTLVDATIIASASEGDDEARWLKHKGKPAVHGFKAHVGADADTTLVEEIAITTANINDGRAGPDALPDDPGEVFADSAYRGSHFRDAVRAKGGVPRIPRPQGE